MESIDEEAHEYRRVLWGKHGVVPSSAVTQAYKDGYNAALDEMNEAGSFEKIPCDCHLSENQVCDFCQEVVTAFRKKIKDKEA